MVTIFAKPFVYTREIEHEEDEEKCLAESGILCSHHEHKTGTVVVLKFQKLFSFCSQINCWFSGLGLMKCLSETV